jgi:predicted nucleotidyltransferase
MKTSGVAEVLTEADVAFAYLFGSRATERHHAGSDADIAIKVGHPLGLLEEAALADRLAMVLQVPAVDLVDLDRASLRLKGRILQEGRILFSKDERARVAFEVRTRSEYFDFLPTLDLHRSRFLRRVAAGGLNG